MRCRGRYGGGGEERYEVGREVWRWRGRGMRWRGRYEVGREVWR